MGPEGVDYSSSIRSTRRVHPTICERALVYAAASGAVHDVIGAALVFPGNAQLAVQNSYISVDLTAVTPLEDVDDGDDVIDIDSEDLDA